MKSLNKQFAEQLDMVEQASKMLKKLDSKRSAVIDLPDILSDSLDREKRKYADLQVARKTIINDLDAELRASNQRIVELEKQLSTQSKTTKKPMKVSAKPLARKKLGKKPAAKRKK